MVSIKESKESKSIQKIKQELQDVSKNKNSLILDNKLDKAYSYRKRESKLITKLNELELSYKKNTHVIKEEDIAVVINQKTNIPIYEILKDNTGYISKLANKMKKTIVGQDNAIDLLINYTKKMRLGYTNNKIKSFLFVGPTGVGKTAIAKLYANTIQGENNLIRLDMSEYSDVTSVNKIIGSSPGYVGYQDNNNILEQIKEKPTAVILLDEIDKAHPNVINLLYQILDEGKINDSQNNTINLNNNIIIMTSNIGFEETTLGFTNKGNDNINSKLKEYLSPSLIN